MRKQRLHLIVIAGPNGAGKSTTAPSLLKGTLKVSEFVIKEVIKTGYTFHMVFLWVPNADFAVARVADRVRMGGHNVPEETIRRRYHSGLRNFFHLYLSLTDTWDLYDNSGPKPRLVAFCDEEKGMIVNDSIIWHNIKKKYEEKKKK